MSTENEGLKEKVEKLEREVAELYRRVAAIEQGKFQTSVVVQGEREIEILRKLDQVKSAIDMLAEGLEPNHSMRVKGLVRW